MLEEKDVKERVETDAQKMLRNGPFKEVIDLKSFSKGLKVNIDPRLMESDFYIGPKPLVDVDPPFRCRCVVEPVAEIIECPVPECFYIVGNACSYRDPKECGIRLNYINGQELDAKLCQEPEIVEGPQCTDKNCFEYDTDYKDHCSFITERRDKCETWIEHTKGESIDKRYTYLEATALMHKVSPCPQCTSDTLIGMYKEGDDCWKVVEPRYCEVCGWKEEG